MGPRSSRGILMGFLDSITGFLNGSPAKSQQTSQSGFALLPQQIQDTYTNYANSVNAQIPNATQAYTPLPQTQGETTALGNLTQGFAPTQQSLNQDISMFMNPYNQNVIDPVNRQANSDFSILKQNASANGQFGSNRQNLGANDIEQTRLNTIGGLQQQGYSSALSSVLNNLIPQRQQDAENALNAGTYQRGLMSQQSAAPITGLQQIAQALGILPTTGGSTSQGTSTGQSKGLIDWLGGS